MSYIVKNCPAILKMTKICDAYEKTRDNPEFCKDIENCVIKQVIEKCNKYKSIYPVMSSVYIFINEILDVFDIEEINK